MGIGKLDQIKADKQSKKCENDHEKWQKQKKECSKNEYDWKNCH